MVKVYPENKKTTEKNCVKHLKIRKVLLDEKNTFQTCKWNGDKVTALNCIPCFFFSKRFRHQGFSERSLRVIKRWFTIVADSEDFLKLDFTCIAAILNSSKLLIDSELQVFNVMNSWLNHKSVERSKHAKYLLQRVRLSLLSVPALNNILNKNLWIVMNVECSEVIRNVIEYKNKFPYNYTNILPRSSYGSQENFDLFIVGGENESTEEVFRDAFTIDSTDFSRVSCLPNINYERAQLETVCIKGEIYVFSGYNYRDNQIMPIEKYSPATKTWNVIANMYDDRNCFCSCSFIDSIYVLGGLLEDETSSCYFFNTINKAWKEITSMKVARQFPSCAVFEGKIVVSGGYNNINDGDLNTVEAYDHIDDSWTNMPSMIEERSSHKSLAIENKLFLIGGFRFNRSIEVFDSHCNQFVLLKDHPEGLSNYIFNNSNVLSIGNKIVIFSNEEGCVVIYDAEINKWEKKSCEATKNIELFSCAILPK